MIKRVRDGERKIYVMETKEKEEVVLRSSEDAGRGRQERDEGNKGVEEEVKEGKEEED